MIALSGVFAFCCWFFWQTNHYIEGKCLSYPALGTVCGMLAVLCFVSSYLDI